MPNHPVQLRNAAATVRLMRVLLGSFCFTWGLVALGVAVQVALGVSYHEAEVAMMLLAFVVFVPLFLWSFAAAGQARVAGLLFGAAMSMAAAAWVIQRALLT